jgi:hypothetical protein
MKDLNLADPNKLSPNSSAPSEMSATEQPATEITALVKSENSTGIAKTTSALAKLFTVTKVALLIGVSFAGSFAIALKVIRDHQISKLPPLSPPTKVISSSAIATPGNQAKPRPYSLIIVTPDNQAKPKPYSLTDEILSLVTFGYVTGLPQDRSIKVSKHNLTGMQMGKYWGKETAFEPVADLSAPPPLSNQPLQTISPQQLPPASFKILPSSLPEALSPINPTDSQTPHALARNKPGDREISIPDNVAEAPKDTLGKTLSTGAQAKASLVNAAVFSSSGTNSSSNPRFVVRLEESLNNPSGKLAFSSDTTLVAVVRPLSSKGVVELEAVSIVVDGKEYNLPPGAITLLDRDGSSLKGLKYGEEETVSSAPAKTSNSSPKPRTGNSNSSELDPTEAASPAPAPDQPKPGNKEAIENVMRQSQFYYIPQGTALKLVVNKTIKL